MTLTAAAAPRSAKPAKGAIKAASGFIPPPASAPPYPVEKNLKKGFFAILRNDGKIGKMKRFRTCRDCFERLREEINKVCETEKTVSLVVRSLSLYNVNKTCEKLDISQLLDDKSRGF